MQELGVALELGPSSIARCIDEAGIGFMYAPLFHPAMKMVRPVRASLKVRNHCLLAAAEALCLCPQLGPHRWQMCSMRFAEH
jgi:hypothetical protein